MSDQTTPKAKSVRVLVDAKIVADLNTWRTSRSSMEDFAKQIEEDAREFVQHCRDHRSIDHIGLEVERIYETQCSSCRRELETVQDPELNEGRKSCAYCGAEMES